MFHTVMPETITSLEAANVFTCHLRGQVLEEDPFEMPIDFVLRVSLQSVILKESRHICRAPEGHLLCFKFSVFLSKLNH